jgi:hypothetical protein
MTEHKPNWSIGTLSRCLDGGLASARGVECLGQQPGSV